MGLKQDVGLLTEGNISTYTEMPTKFYFFVAPEI